MHQKQRQATQDVSSLPKPTKYRDGTEFRAIGLEIEQLPLLGTTEIESIGSENIYIKHRELHYYCKVMDTERYQVGLWNFQRHCPEITSERQPEEGKIHTEISV